jgi:cyanophycinase
MKIVRPKGKLIPMGGGVDKSGKKTIMCRLLEETKKRKPKICLLTMASKHPEKEIEAYKTCFRSLQEHKFFHIHYESRLEINEKKEIEKIKMADMVIMSGGDQLKLSSLLGGTKLLEEMRTRYYDDDKFIVAGSSAGATAMSGTMIIAGESQNSLIKGELELTNGLDFISTIFIDTHFTERGRVGRLLQTVTHNPGVIGIGFGENTAAIITHGEKMEVVGSGLMVVVQGRDICFTNLSDIQDNDPITVEEIKISTVGHGYIFSIKERKILNRVKN